jgi:hypothetical protein
MKMVQVAKSYAAMARNISIQLSTRLNIKRIYLGLLGLWGVLGLQQMELLGFQLGFPGAADVDD